MAPSINACLKRSKPLILLDNHLLRFLAVLRVGVLERCVWRVWIVTRNPVRCKYACATALLRMPASRRRISREIQNSIALAASLCRESIYISLFASIREVILAHFVPSLILVTFSNLRYNYNYNKNEKTF